MSPRRPYRRPYDPGETNSKWSIHRERVPVRRGPVFLVLDVEDPGYIGVAFTMRNGRFLPSEISDGLASDPVLISPNREKQLVAAVGCVLSDALHMWGQQDIHELAEKILARVLEEAASMAPPPTNERVERLV